MKPLLLLLFFLCVFLSGPCALCGKLFNHFTAFRREESLIVLRGASPNADENKNWNTRQAFCLVSFSLSHFLRDHSDSFRPHSATRQDFRGYRQPELPDFNRVQEDDRHALVDGGKSKKIRSAKKRRV